MEFYYTIYGVVAFSFLFYYYKHLFQNPKHGAYNSPPTPPSLQATEHLSCGLAMFGFAPYGPYWRHMRRLELQRRVRESETARSVSEIYKLWEEKRDGSGRVVVDMKKWFGELSLNVVMRVVAGRRLGDDTAETRRCREAMREFFHLAGMFVPADALPFLKWLDIGGYEKRMKQNAMDLDRMSENGWRSGKRNIPARISRRIL